MGGKGDGTAGAVAAITGMRACRLAVTGGQTGFIDGGGIATRLWNIHGWGVIPNANGQGGRLAVAITIGQGVSEDIADAPLRAFGAGIAVATIGGNGQDPIVPCNRQ